MGCDIHLYTEVRENGEWKPVDKWNKDEDGGMTAEGSLYGGRNYNLFGILANVRNGYGFAGIKTGEGFHPISCPRGLPSDVSSPVKACSDRWGVDGHSHSYLTLAELLAYDWTQTTKLQGWVNGPTFAKWSRWGRQRGESPENSCGLISGRDIKHVTVEEMEKLIDKAEDIETLGNIYCLVEWEQPYYKAVGSFISTTMPKLWHLGKSEDVRIVFWFDN